MLTAWVQWILCTAEITYPLVRWLRQLQGKSIEGFGCWGFKCLINSACRVSVKYDLMSGHPEYVCDGQAWRSHNLV